MAAKSSPFLYPGVVATADCLAIVHLKRDLQIPTILKKHDEDDDGYSEGKVVNTRFGSFPHTTLIGLPWGSQVRASKVDTGSRGRRPKAGGKKRKRQDSAELPNKTPTLEENASTPARPNEETEAIAASSGFIHLLPPTPENWTSSLPHRTQVVYTPDYSYILHQIRARPGTSLIEAGAGSGSFTHASSRAVFNGSATSKPGKVWSFEFHAQRHEKLQEEIQAHGLEHTVQITHRDVCEGGFLVDGKSPGAESVFLDLPAPWLALPHLSRSKPASSSVDTPFVSPLSATAPVHICTFSPCIEQVQRTVSVMRQLGWVDIEMVEMAQKRFEIRRERIGMDNGAQRGLQLTPASVDEAVARLKEVEGTFKSFHENGEKIENVKKPHVNPNSREKLMESLIEKKLYKEGNLIHRTEPDVKTHTSYLVLAVLPREWSEEDELLARAKWPIIPRKEGDSDKVIGINRNEMKKAERKAVMDAADAMAKAKKDMPNGEDAQMMDAADTVGKAKKDMPDGEDAQMKDAEAEEEPDENFLDGTSTKGRIRFRGM